VKLPSVKGRISLDRDLDRLTWLQVGGPAKIFFQPFDISDLKTFLSEISINHEVFPIGVGSNILVRDGGINAAVIRLSSKYFNYVKQVSNYVKCGAGTLDSHVAIKAAELGLDLTFLRTIPGTIGGAIAMNAGCYGAYVEDFLVEVTVVNSNGSEVRLSADKIKFGYRSSDIPKDSVIVEAVFAPAKGQPDVLKTKMLNQLEGRNRTQPIDKRTAGSTFRNPSGASSSGKRGESMKNKAWKLLDDAGLRGLSLGGAQVSEKHPNFMINKGNATSKDFESLGELMRKKVLQNSGIELQWEVIRVGVE